MSEPIIRIIDEWHHVEAKFPNSGMMVFSVAREVIEHWTVVYNRIADVREAFATNPPTTAAEAIATFDRFLGIRIEAGATISIHPQEDQ